jgi:hypothetical protein
MPFVPTSHDEAGSHDQSGSYSASHLLPRVSVQTSWQGNTCHTFFIYCMLHFNQA